MLSKLIDALRRVLQFKVRRWHVSMGGWNEHNARIIIGCDAQIWYWILIEFVAWDLQTYLCHWLGYIPLPGFICRIKGHWDKDELEYFEPFGQWFGNDVGSLWHSFVCDPLLQWVWKHKGQNEVSFELTLDEARKKFAHDPEQYQWVERHIEEYKRYDAEQTAEIREKYRKGELTREEALEKLEWIDENDDLGSDKLAEILDKASE